MNAVERTTLSKNALEREFNQRAERWETESAIYSSPGAKLIHKDYKAIIRMGEPVIPLILKRMQTSHNDWLWALEHIVEGENPAAGINDFDSAVQAWLEWGRKRYPLA
jgi:hypothetical protein